MVVAPTQTTCNDRTIDFFVVSKRIAHAVYAIYRLEDSNVSPHYGVRMLLRSDARRHQQRVLVKPPKIEESKLGQGPADLKEELELAKTLRAKIAKDFEETEDEADSGGSAEAMQGIVEEPDVEKARAVLMTGPDAAVADEVQREYQAYIALLEQKGTEQNRNRTYQHKTNTTPNRITEHST